MDVSKNLEDRAKKYGASVRDLIMADLVGIGYSENDAYAIAYNGMIPMSTFQMRDAREKTLKKAGYKRALSARLEQQGMSDHLPVDGEDELIDKRKTAKLIMTAALKQPNDSKERIEGLMKYADIMGYKKDVEEADATESISFFFPLKCNQCPFLFAYNETASKKDQVRPVEMGRIIEMAQPIIKKAKKKSAEA